MYLTMVILSFIKKNVLFSWVRMQLWDEKQKHGSAYIVSITLFTKLQPDDILVLGDNKHSRTREKFINECMPMQTPTQSATENAYHWSIEQNQDPSKSVPLYQTFK